MVDHDCTMTIITLILLLATGIVTVTAVEDEINEKRLIKTCCELSTDFTFSFARGADTPGVYLLNNFCGHEHMKTGLESWLASYGTG